MAQRFAVKAGNWSDTTVWDSGAEPTSADDVYANGFAVTIDKDVSVASLRNTATTVSIQNIATPVMFNNTSPSGTVISSNNASNAYISFNQDGSNTNYWTSGVTSTGWIGYTFLSAKTIKRYIIKISNVSAANPRTWTFEGSNDGFATPGVSLDYVASYTTSANYTSVLLSNTTSYTSYRINVTAVQGAATVALSELEMTESTNAAPFYGGVTGGSFTVPSSLSGTRNIVQSGAGIICNNSATVVSVAALTGNTVNFNISSGGYIVNPNYRTTNMTNPAINITGTAAINFNSDLWGSQTTSNTYSTGGAVGINAAATITVNGNIYADKGTDGAPTYYAAVVYLAAANCTANIVGSIIGSDFKAYGYPIVSTAINTLNVTGNVTGNISNAIYSNISGFICNITGNITVFNTTSQPAIYFGPQFNTSLLTVNGSIVNKGNLNCIYVQRIRFTQNTNPYWVFQNTAGTNITLAYGSAIGEFPNEADVKLGVTYAASPTRIGTCAVPLSQYVSQGVATGSTVGTAYLNAADVWNIQTSTLTTAGSIGERLKTASTVQTNGDQLASYIV